MDRNAKLFFFLFLFFCTSILIGCTSSNQESVSEIFNKIEASIPMRDGVHLNTEIYVPINSTDPLPFMYNRTPYGLSHDDNGFHRSLSSNYKELVDERYIFVFQDIRGRYQSEGKFVMLRTPRDKSDPDAIDEGTDTYDTIDWLLKNVDNNNGRVGIMGISYGGWLTVMAMIEPHPAVKAVSPQASPADMYIGDDFVHNGAFRLSPSFGYAALMETSNINEPFHFDQKDTYDWYLDLGPLSNGNAKHFNRKLPSWNDFMNHPNYDEYWQRQSVPQYLKSVTVPTLNVAGWWDAEDFYGPMKIYETLEQKDSNNMNYLVVGPWRHGGWARGDGDKLFDIDFGSPTSKYYRENIQAPWFAFLLKDKGNLDLPEATTFQSGANKWMTYEAWPPSKDATIKKLYFNRNFRLSFDEPKTTDRAFDSYISDPANPVPYTKRPIRGFWQGAQAKWKVEDQRFVYLRPDVLSWKTETLQKDVVVSGRIIAKLFASTSGSDCDWIVKLIDVYPEENETDASMNGYQLMVADEVLRAKFRNSFSNPEPLIPNKTTEFTIDLNSRNHRFREGHKIMVQVQSTWFPLIGRNPQKFMDIPKAKEEDYKKAEHRIYRSREFPSHIVLPISNK